MAATNINRVVLTGNLTRDPELRSLSSGMSVCKLRVACNTRRKNNATGDWEDKPNYFDVTVWGAQGENCARFLVQGPPRRHRRPARVARVGDRTARSARRVEIIADSVQFLGGRDEGSAAAAAASRRAPTCRSTSATSSPPARRPPTAPAAPRPTTTSRSDPRRAFRAGPGLRGGRRIADAAGARALRSSPAPRRGAALGRRPPRISYNACSRANGARAQLERAQVFFQRGLRTSGEAAQPADAPA